MDFSQHLPLSQGGRDDESAVTSDWRPLTGECLRLLIGLLTDLTPGAWSLRSSGGVPVAARVSALADRLDRPRGRGVVTGLIARLRTRTTSRPDTPVDAGDQHEAPGAIGAVGTGGYLDALLRHADERVAGRGRRGIGDLLAVVVEGLDIAAAVGHPLALPERATGAVALALATSAPTPLAAVIRGRCLVAADADWRIGRGPQILAPAGELVLFLAGRTGMPGVTTG